MILKDQLLPLVSVIVPCYNHARYLAEAIESIESQSYPRTEIIVINDGSTDNTEEVAKSYNKVIYHYQRNQGLSAARNTGISIAKGDYLIFLDADDILLPEAIATQVALIEQSSEIAFVSGGHITSDERLENQKVVSADVKENHYLHLLQRNYIGMHAAVMYRRTIISNYLFDTSFEAVEDYDVYLRIAADHPLLNHKTPIAVYRSHGNNMSADVQLMLQHALMALEKQKSLLNTSEKINAYNKGIENWVDFYSYYSYGLLKKIGFPANKKYRQNFLRLLWTYKRKLYIKYHLRKILLLSKSF